MVCCVLYPFHILSLSLFLLFTPLQHLFLFLLSQSCRTVAFCSRCFMTLTIDLAGLCRRRGRGSRAEREEGGDHLVAGSAGSNNGMLGILRQLPNKRNMSTTSCHLLLCCLPLAPPATCHLPPASCHLPHLCIWMFRVYARTWQRASCPEMAMTRAGQRNPFRET